MNSRSSWGAFGRPTFFALVFLVACAPQESPKRSLTEVLNEVSPRLIEIPGVVMVYESALSDGSPCIKVGVEADTPEVRQAIGTEIEGYPVVIVETGPVEPK